MHKTPRHCHQCGRRLTWKKEEGKKRRYCRACRLFTYENPLPVAGVVCLNRKNEILMIQRAQEPGIGQWAFPSGFLEISEHPEEAALRELYEETGIRGKIVSLLGVFEKTGAFYKSLLVVFYLARVVGGRLRKSRETMDLGFFPLDQLKPVGFKTHNEVLKKYVDLHVKGSRRSFNSKKKLC